MNMCINCKHYQAGDTELDDKCMHAQAFYNAVREVKHYSCIVQRAGKIECPLFEEAVNAKPNP